MTSHRKSILSSFAALLNYPGDDYAAATTALSEVLSAHHPDMTDELRPFQQFVAENELHELEEQFTRTFEINPQCALELGWHLFGEEYLRGQFLVRMRELLRQYRLPESTELPDHVTHVLAVLAAMPQKDAEEFAGACVLPALDRMLLAFEGKQNSYEHLLRSLRQILCREFDFPAEESFAEDEEDGSEQTDPLWRFPGPGRPDIDTVEFVPLELRYDDEVRAKTDAIPRGPTS